MPHLKNYPVYQQAVANSCWAWAARSMLNYNFGGKPRMIQSDQDLANDWAKRTHDQAHSISRSNNPPARPWPTSTFPTILIPLRCPP